MTRLFDISSAWQTLTSLDTSSIREASEQAFTLTCIGDELAQDQIRHLLTAAPTGETAVQRYGLPNESALQMLSPLQVNRTTPAFANADLIVVAQRTSTIMPELPKTGSRPLVHITLINAPGDPVPYGSLAINPHHPAAAARLADAILEKLPEALHLAAARQFQALRPVFARKQSLQVAMTNALYAGGSSAAALVPALSLPFAAADLLVLTKNQALMVYTIALAYGAPPDFKARIAEIMPVVGGAYVWRSLARQLIGLVPVAGVVPKIAIAYAGTYVTGIVAAQWYAYGTKLPREELKATMQRALNEGRERAQLILEKTRAGVSNRLSQMPRLPQLPRMPWKKRQLPDVSPDDAHSKRT